MKKEQLINRFLEILPGAVTWLILTSPFWLSLHLPLFMAGIILFLDLYWFYRALRIAFFCFIGYQKMRQAEKTNWVKKLEQENPCNLSYEHSLNWKNIYHLLVIPTYKEPLAILEQNLRAISKQTFPWERIFVLVALEEREGREIIEKKVKFLKQKFANCFGALLFTIHPQDYPGHHPGPGSNRTYAVQKILPFLQERGVSFSQVILTTLDADFVIHPRFLAGLTYKYLTTPRAEKRTFTGVFWYYNNFWQAPALNRIVASGVSFWQLSEMTGSNKYFNFSSHSINLQSLVAMNYWVVDKVNDDGEFFWRAYYHFAGDYQVIPHFLPIMADTVQTETWWGSLKEQYLQLRRWAYGVEHLPMIIRRYFQRKDIPFWDRTDKVFFLFRSYITWSTLAVLITFGGLIVDLVNPQFSSSVFAYNLPYYSSTILTIAIFSLFILIFLHEKLVPPRPTHWSRWQRWLSFWQWFLVPLVVLTYGTLPAIDSQTRLMLGRYMEFRVTRKFRSPATVN